jgi:hypothetical protein
MQKCLMRRSKQYIVKIGTQPVKNIGSFLATRVNCMNSTQKPAAILTGASGIGLGITLGRDPDPKTNMSDTTSPRQIRLERRSPSYWRVTFDHPPLNIFGPETIPQLNEITTALETDKQVKVVVFDGLPLSTNRPSRKQSAWSMLPAYRRTRKLCRSGTHLLPLWGGRPAGRG